MNEEPKLSKTWLITAPNDQWSPTLIAPEIIKFAKMTGYYGASRYAFRKWGNKVAVTIIKQDG